MNIYFKFCKSTSFFMNDITINIVLLFVIVNDNLSETFVIHAISNNGK